MKGTVNKVILIGRLGADPDFRYAPSGSPVVNFSLATNWVSRSKDGESQEFTEWHRVVAWNRLAEIVKEYVKKGHRVYVEGRIRYRDWEDQNGQRRFTTEIIATNIQLLESAGAPSIPDEGIEPEPPDTDEAPPEDENIPF